MKVLFEQENFFHPSIIPYRGRLMMVMQKILAMDRFTVPYFSFSDDGGESWSTPELIPTLAGFEKCADFRPVVLPDDNKVLIIGLVSDGTDKDAMYSGYKSVCLIYDGEWSAPQDLFGKEEYNHRAACAQTALAPDGTIVIPLYFGSPKKGGFKVQTRKFLLKDGSLVPAGSGNVLESGIGNGWHEPSVEFFKGTFYLTLRCTTGYAWFAESTDGLNWSKPKKWTFSDGSVMETGPTQQHWMKKKDSLWLVYTRRDVSNEDCFRWRTPMFAAPFNPENGCLEKSGEEIIIPRIDWRTRPGLLGNFNVTNLENCVYISDAPLWFDWTPDKEHIAWFSTSVVWKKIVF